MSLVYIGKIITPNPEIEKLPPSVISSSWFAEVISSIQSNGKFVGDRLNGHFEVTFNDRSELETWIASHELTDSALINDVKVWNATYGVTHVNEIHHDDKSVEATTLSVIPLE